MDDKFDEQAAALLPLYGQLRRIVHYDDHGELQKICEAAETSVAAKLRELEQKAFEQINTLCSDITDLRQQLAVLRNGDRLCNYLVWDNGDMRDCGNVTTLRRCSEHAPTEIKLRQQLAEKALEREELTRTFSTTIERLEREKADLQRERDEARAKLRKAANLTAWLIEVSGYGKFLFLGTEAQAEEMRSHKANWEGGVRRKYQLRELRYASMLNETGRIDFSEWLAAQAEKEKADE